ncbi:MAG: alpha-galactosidase [Firmicutes bacterium]|nr:alpha-galactosidase [Bacillota bacterium]
MINADPKRGIFHLTCEEFSYILQIKDGRLLQLYFGAPIADADLSYLLPCFASGSSFNQPVHHLPLELPTLGSGWYGEPALGAIGSDGNNVTELRYQDYKILPHKEDLPGLPSLSQPPTAMRGQNETKDDGTLQILLKDELTGLAAVLSYSIVSGTLARSMELINTSDAPIKLTHMASATLTLPLLPPAGSGDSDYSLIHLQGNWARERRVVRTPLGRAETKIESQRGASGHEENPFLALAAPGADENSGDIYALSLIYSGSFQASAQVRDFDNVYLSIGLNPLTHNWLLESGEHFVCPEAVLVYANRGLNQMSHLFHRIYRDHLCRSKWAGMERPVLINNWEATYFDINEEKVMALAKTAAKIGVELLVMDDGWFGNRFDDHRSLGDWYENPIKLPHGLAGLAKKVNQAGLKFGLWVEPEMISPDSDLYRAHPDWCLHAPGRTRTEGRNQLILDLSREDVQDFIIHTMKHILNSANIAYIKWDMNRNMTESFSALQTPERQMETQHRYMLGLYRVLDEVTSAFPDVLFESCSGGGGRFDAGMLYYMPQTWTSDDTDAVERLKIQYGTSLVYPASAMGAHVSASPNHQVGRKTDISMRADVAIGGNFGFELDLDKLSREDLAAARDYVAKVKKLRHLTSQGTFSRLLSPFDAPNYRAANYVAWQFADQQDLLLCIYRVLSEPNPFIHRVRLTDLDPNALYQADETDPSLPACFKGRTFTGAALMQVGVPMIFKGQQDFCSQLILFHRVKEK